MNRPNAHKSRLLATLLTMLLASGCAATFSAKNASEVSRERLLELSEQGKSDHLLYAGSDFSWHYVYDSRPGKGKTYKIRADSLKLRETFRVGEDDYVLHPWLIEGKALGTTAEEAVTNAPPAEDDR